MKIALIRGPNLNPFEMQCYLPLAEEHRLFGFATAGAPLHTSSPEMEVRVLSSPAELMEKAPARLRRLNYHLLSSGLGAGKTWLFGLEKQLRRMDIIQAAETSNAYSFQALRAKRKWGGALLITAWENIPFNFESHPLTRYMKARVRDGADHFIAVTNQARACLLAEGVDLARISVISAGIDLRHFTPGAPDPALRAKFGLTANRPLVLFVGRLVPEKGVHDLLAALHHLQNKLHLEADLLMVGEGREKERLEQEACRLGLEDRLHMHPPVPYQEMSRVYHLADLFVLPSRPTSVWQEQFGMVLAEAMACKLPLVGTDSGAIPEVVGPAGIIVPAASPPKLAGAIARILQNQDLRRDFEEAALRHAKKNFSHLTISQRLGEVYQMVHEEIQRKAAACAVSPAGLSPHHSQPTRWERR